MSRTATRLPPGNWRLDPFTRVLRYVFEDPTAKTDAFDEPLEPIYKPSSKPGPKTGKSHGDIAGVRRHERNREPMCDDCKRARTDYRNALEERLAAKNDPRYTCPDCGMRKSRESKACNRCALTRRYSRTRQESVA